MIFFVQRFRGKVDKDGDGWDRNFAIVISDDDYGGGDNFVTPSVDANDTDADESLEGQGERPGDRGSRDRLATAHHSR